MTLRTRAVVLSKDVIRWLRLLYMPASLGFVSYFLFKYWGEAQRVFGSYDLSTLLVVIILCSIVHVFAASSYCFVVGTSGNEIRLGESFRVHFSKLPARYLPGGIWHSAGKILDLGDQGFKRSELSMILFLEVATVWSAALLVFFFFSAHYEWLILFVAFSVFVLFALSHFFMTVVRLKAVVSVTLFLPVWFVYGVAFYLYLQPSGLISSPDIFQVIANYSLSSFAGFLAIFAPQGIGVSETVFLYLEDIEVSIGLGITYLVGFRFAVVVGDVAAYMMYVLWNVRK